MCKRLLILATVMLMAAPAFANVGIFDYTDSIGIGGFGVTTNIGDAYEIIAGGHDIWDNSDDFHFAYNQVTGNIRFELSPAWEVAPEYWSKIETMIRVDNSGGSVAYATATRRGNVNTEPLGVQPVHDWVGTQIRSVAGENMWSGTEWGGNTPVKIGSQRVVSNGYQVVQALVDFGSGWEALDTRIVPDLPDEVLVGAAVTSHHRQGLARAIISDVAYTENPDLVGVGQAGDPLAEACSDIPGLLITAAKLPTPWTFWDDQDGSNGDARADKYAQAEYLIKNGTMDGYTDAFGTVTGGIDAVEMGSRIEPVVNLYDTGGYNAFDDDTESSFPGIDAYVMNPGQPADGDDDNQFAVLVQGCIELTEGLHILGGAFDDGILIRIGGVEIGRTNSWNEVGQWMFEAPTTGVYEFEAVGYEETGGAYLELYEWLPDGSMILIGAEGGSPVYVPEPATIALLGFGGLSMLRIRRKR